MNLEDMKENTTDLVGYRKTTTLLRAKERKLIKRLRFSNNIILHSGKKGKSTLIWKYPLHFNIKIVVILLYSLRNYQIHNNIFNHKAVDCIEALIHMGCNPLLDLYIIELSDEIVSIKTWIKCLELLINYFGFHVDNTTMHTACKKLSNLGVPHDYLEQFLITNYLLDTPRLIKNLNKLNAEWNNFWQFKTTHNCIFCKLDLTKLTPITRRLETISETLCCKLACCKFCYQNLLESQGQCPACNTFIDYDKYTDKSEIDIDSDNLHYVSLRQYHRVHQNLPFKVSSDRQKRIPFMWNQPGTNAFGNKLLENRTHILSNYRFNKIIPNAN